ncbi:hypothetical protein HYS10_01845 [Candidatus Collierbacteria bacterium]|nr:hypothetical protein [Candidatus Collierbacteria bacterium]
MNIQRITVSLPKHIHEELLNSVGKRQLSRFVAEAVEEHILEQKTKSGNPIADFFNLRNKLPKFSNKKIMEAIKKGRT